MTITVSTGDAVHAGGPGDDEGVAWLDDVLVVAGTAPGDGAAVGPAARELAGIAATVTGPPLLAVVLDPAPGRPAADLPARAAEALRHRGGDQDVLLLTTADTGSGDVAAELAAATGRRVVTATTRVGAHPQGGLVALDGGTFVDGADPAGILFPRPAWTEHVPTQSAFVGERGLLDPVPAGVWIHADPAARSPQQRLGRLVHGLPPVPLWPVVVLGTPGGPALDLDAVAASLAARPELVRRSVFVPFGLGLPELGALADRLGHGLDAVTAMVVVGESGSAVVRTVGRDGHVGWTPLVSRVRFEPGHAAPEPTLTRNPVRPDELGATDADELRVDAVPAGLWLRTAASDDLPAAPGDPRAADVELGGLRLFVGDPGRVTGTALVQRAAALLGRLDPALRQGARIVMVGSTGATPAAAPPVEPPPALEQPAPDAALPDAPLPLDPPPGPADDQDRLRVREALGGVYGRLSGRTATLLALEPGRGAGRGGAAADLVALGAVLDYAASTGGGDPSRAPAEARDVARRPAAELIAALADERAAPALLRCASAGARWLATHRGIGFARLPAGSGPVEGDVLVVRPFSRLATSRPAGADPDSVVLALRCRTVRRLGDLAATGAGDLLTVPGLRVRVQQVRVEDGTTLALATEVSDAEHAEDADGVDWFDGRTLPDDAAGALSVWLSV